MLWRRIWCVVGMIHLVLDRVLVLVLRLQRPRRWVVVRTRLGIRGRRLDRRGKAGMGAGHRGDLDNPCSGVMVVVIVVGAETWFFFVEGWTGGMYAVIYWWLCISVNIGISMDTGYSGMSLDVVDLG